MMASRKRTWWGHPTLFSLFGTAAEPEPTSKPPSTARQPTPKPSPSTTSGPVTHSGKNKQLRLDFTSSTAANQNGTLPPKPLTNGTPPKSQLPIPKPPQQQKRLFDLFLKPLVTPKPHKTEEGPSSADDTTFPDQIAKHPLPSIDRNQTSPPLAAETTTPGIINLPHSPTTFTGEKGSAQELIAAIRILKTIEAEQRPATAEE